MKHINYFLNQGLNISVKDNGNLSITGLSSLQSDARDQVLQYARGNKWRILFELETRNKTIEEKIKILWAKADKLAGWIDDPDSEIPWQERTKYVPKLLEMSVRIGELEVKPANDKQTVKNLKPRKSVSTITTIKQRSGYCPAQCKKTGYCYGQVYFKGKPGKPEYCSKNACGYNYELSQWQEYQPSIKQKITKQEGA